MINTFQSIQCFALDVRQVRGKQRVWFRQTAPSSPSLQATGRVDVLLPRSIRNSRTISPESGIKRSTAGDACEKLVVQGLVREGEEAAGRVHVVSPTTLLVYP